MKRVISTMLVTALLFTMMSMTVFASYVPSQGDQYVPEKEEPAKVPGAPKTGDDRMVLYTAVMAAFATAGTAVIAKRKED